MTSLYSARLYDDSVQAFEVYFWRFGSWCVRGVVVGGVDVKLHCTWHASPWRTPILQCWVGFKQSLNYSPNSAQDSKSNARHLCQDYQITLNVECFEF